MDEAMLQKLRSKTAATEAAIREKQAATLQAEQEARAAQNRSAEAERNLCNTAERICNNWLEPLCRDFAKHVPTSFDPTIGSAGDGISRDSRDRTVRISGGGNDKSGTYVRLTVDSESALKISIYSEVNKRSVGLPTFDKVFPIAVVGQHLSLVDEAAATEWTTDNLIDAFDKMKQTMGGL